jgi:hypothetical protein
MEQLIREKRRIKFNHLRIDSSILKKLSKIISGEADALNVQGIEYYVNYSLEGDDDSSYESQSATVFDENVLLGLKRFVKIVMRFNAFDFSKNIEVVITHKESDQEGDNYIMISGSDTNWVNGILGRIDDLIKSAEPQPQVLGYFSFLNFGVFFLLNIVYYRLFYSDIDQIKNEWIRAGLMLAPIVLGFWGLSYMGTYFKKILPEVELRTGPAHEQLPSNGRKRVTNIFLALILPLLLALAYDLLKGIIL